MISKVHPLETFRNNLIGVANWILFLLLTRVTVFISALGFLARHSGKTLGLVKMEDPWDAD